MGPTGNSSDSWETKAERKREVEFAKIPTEWRLPAESISDASSQRNVLNVPAECGILTKAELDITEKYTAITLAEAVQSGTIRAVDVAIASSKRAAIAQQLTSCLTETFFDDAISRGKWLDDYLTAHQAPVGPLHGVPVSLKDSFNYTGVASTLGLVSFLDNPLPTENSPLVDILLDLGAILYCKTNIPQTLMTADSHNNVFGRVLNPQKLSLTAGGSSGGEGALVAMRGSMLGVGTDIAGSVRIPALCNGTYGYKPTPDRIPYGGQASCHKDGAPGFPPVAGPLANSFEDLQLFTQSVLETKPWNKDASAVILPWRTNVASSCPTKLRVGYYKEDPVFAIHPPVERALEDCVRALTAAGYDVIALTSTPSLKTGVDLSFDYFALDNAHVDLEHVQKSGEPFVPSVQRSLDVVVKKAEGYTLEELFDLNATRDIYKAAWNKVWVEHDLDIILCPGAQTTAVPHDEYGFPPYTVLWNLLDCPGIIIPVHKADREVDKDHSMKPHDKTYSGDDVHGTPTSVQVVARSFQDEELIAAAGVVDRCLHLANPSK